METRQKAADTKRLHLIATAQLYGDEVIEIVPGIVADPTRAFGKPVIAGTRLPAAVVLGLLAAGRSESEILAEYDLTPDQLRAALRYAAWLAS